MMRLKTWEELTIQDNFLFQKVMRNQRLCKHLIEKILNIKIQSITYPDAEKTIDIRLDSKSVRLDVYVEDTEGTVYDIEMQCTDGTDGELAKRTRYYQGMIDMELLGKGKDKTYDQLNRSYIIFICTFDLFKKGLPMYTFRHLCVEDPGIEMGDEATKIFLNSTSTATNIDPDIVAFLRYVNGKSAEGVFVQSIADEVARIKQHDETRREYMSLDMDLKIMRKKVRLEGIQEGIRKTAVTMLEDGVPKETISKYTHLSLQDIEKLAKQL